MKFIICNSMLLSRKTTVRHNTVCIQLFKEKLPKKVQKNMQQPQKALWVVFRSQFFLTSEFKENLQNITVRMRCRGLDDSFLLLLFLFARLTFNFHLNEK